MLRIRSPFRLLEWMGLNALLVFVLGACGILETGLRTLYWVRPEQNLVRTFSLSGLLCNFWECTISLIDFQFA